jgi:hypothetical protein
VTRKPQQSSTLVAAARKCRLGNLSDDAVNSSDAVGLLETNAEHPFPPVLAGPDWICLGCQAFCRANQGSPAGYEYLLAPTLDRGVRSLAGAAMIERGSVEIL